MAREDGPGDGSRELRLEGFTLVLAGGVLVALLIGAFQLGRAVERRSAPAPANGSVGSSSRGDAAPEEVPENLTFFDTLQDTEPKREAAGASPRPASTPPPAASSAGPWFVQVFVGRDRAAAEEVVKTLREKGYPVRAEAVREGATTSLFKVRVGGFPTREAADAAAERLHGDGQASTWVVKTGA